MKLENGNEITTITTGTNIRGKRALLNPYDDSKGDYCYEAQIYDVSESDKYPNVELTNYIANRVMDTGGSFVRCHPIEHLTKVRCREDVLNEFKNNKMVTDKFQLNIIRLNRWWWSVAFIDKEKL